MKTAVVLTGHMRCWETAFTTIKQKFIDKYSADVYIATWDNLGFWTSPENDPNKKGINENSPFLDVQYVIDAYKPKAISVFEQEHMMPVFDRIVSETQIDKISIQIRPKNIVSQFWIQNRGIELIYSHYDYIIRLRPDIIFSGDLPEFNMDETYVLNHPNHEGNGVGDMFLATNFNNMQYYKKQLLNGLGIEQAWAIGRFCPHILTETVIKELNPKILYVAKTLAHTPNGQYQDWKLS